MTKKKLIELLAAYPDNTEITTWNGLTWKKVKYVKMLKVVEKNGKLKMAASKKEFEECKKIVELVLV